MNRHTVNCVAWSHLLARAMFQFDALFQSLGVRAQTEAGLARTESAQMPLRSDELRRGFPFKSVAQTKPT